MTDNREREQNSLTPPSVSPERQRLQEQAAREKKVAFGYAFAGAAIFFLLNITTGLVPGGALGGAIGAVLGLAVRKGVNALRRTSCNVGALYLGFKSLGKDRIWPWRWTLPYFGNLLVRGGCSVLFVYGAVVFVEEKRLDGWGFIAVLVGVGILLLYTLFSSEFELFKEKKDSGKSTEQPPNTARWLYGSAAGMALIGAAIILRAIRNRSATQSLMFETDLPFFDLGFIGGAGVLVIAVLVALLTRKYVRSR